MLCTQCRTFVDFFEHDYQAIQEWRVPHGCHLMETQSEWLHSNSLCLQSNIGELGSEAAKDCHLCIILRQHVRTVASEAGKLPLYIKPHTSWRKQPLKISASSSKVEVSVRIGRFPVLRCLSISSLTPLSHFFTNRRRH
jgi:hypothetical protein